MALSDEIASLKSALAELAARVAAIEAAAPAKPAPAPAAKPAPAEARFAVLTGPEARAAGCVGAAFPGSSFVKPTPGELLRLHEIVMAAHPELWGRYNPSRRDIDEHFVDFAKAFLQFSCAFRTPEIDRRRNARNWVDRHLEFSREHDGVASEIRLLPLIAAAFAHGDIAIQADPNNYLPATAFALSPHQGKPATDGWRAVLANGQPPAVIIAPPPGGRRAVG